MTETVKTYVTVCRHIEGSIEDLFSNIIGLNHSIVSEYIPRFLAKLPVIVAVPCWLILSVLWIALAGPLTLIVNAVLWLVCTILTPFTTARQDWLTPEYPFLVILGALWTLICFVCLRFMGCGFMFAGIAERQKYATA